jgi:PPOX class probable F420-dependent enzyme
VPESPAVASRRDEIQMTESELRAFLDEQMVMQCATVGPHGRPHMVPLWFVSDGSELRGWTYAKSQKARNLERDPRATVGIEDGVQYQELRGVMFECDVAVERDPAEVERHGLALFERYAGELTPEIREMVEKQAQKRVGLTFAPSRVVTWDHRKLGGTY